MYLPEPIPTSFEPDALHIPDGFLSAPVAIVGYVVSAVFIAIAVRKLNVQMGEKVAPLMGVLAAFIFAGQMINFPVSGGTSAHLLGGSLAVLLLGPWAAIIVVAAVLTVQALIFQDGGVSALGTNIANMAVVAPLLTYVLYKAVSPFIRGSQPARYAAVFAASWVAVIVASILTAVELAVSGTSDIDVALPAMLATHLLFGVGEGLITVAAVALVESARPDLVETADTRSEVAA
jgi:cobalt/nickel transport system permease protein